MTSVDGIVEKGRAEMPEMPVDECTRSFAEADLVLTEEDALQEANRCLACCRTCCDKDVTA